MGRSNIRKIAGQNHLKKKKVQVSSHTRGGRKIKSYPSNRWKRKHPPRKVILPAHPDRDPNPDRIADVENPPRGPSGRRGGREVRFDGPTDARTTPAGGTPPQSPEDLERMRVRSIPPPDAGELWRTINRPDAAALWDTVSTDVDLHTANQERIAAEEAAQAADTRRLRVLRAKEEQQKKSFEDRKVTREKMDEFNKDMRELQGAELSPARHKELSDRIKMWHEWNETQWEADQRANRSSTEGDADVKKAQRESAESVYNSTKALINLKQAKLDTTTKKPIEYKEILKAIERGNERDEKNLLSAEIYKPIPETWSEKAKRKLSKKDRQTAERFGELPKWGSQLQYLDDLSDVADEAARTGRWRSREVEKLQEQIKSAREGVFKRVVEADAYHPDNSPMIHPMIGDAALLKYIQETKRFERQAGKYQRTMKGLDAVEEMFKERRTLAQAYLKNRQGAEQLNRPRTIVALTDLYIEKEELRDRDNPLEQKEVFDTWAKNIGMKDRFLTDRPRDAEVEAFHTRFKTDESLVIERARFTADVNASITRAQYLGGYDIKVDGKKQHIKGILDLQEDLKKDQKPILTGRQMQEWIELHPDIEFGKGVPYDSAQVSPELAQLGATVDLKDLTRQQLITSRRDPFDQSESDLTLGLFKHPNKKTKQPFAKSQAALEELRRKQKQMKRK